MSNIPTYPKIQSIYKRDPDNNFKTFLSEYSTPEIAYLADSPWLFTEKVDGTNVRIFLDGTGGYEVGGRTASSQMPSRLAMKAISIATGAAGTYDYPMTLFGEGYGAGIQKGGKYRSDIEFILFDVKVGDLWLKFEDVRDVGNTLGIDVVPDISNLGVGYLDGDNLEAAIALVQTGFMSVVASPDLPSFPAEGLVLRPKVDLLDRMGHRIITKVKHKDFPK